MIFQDNVIKEYLKKCLFCNWNTLWREDNYFTGVGEAA